ncbi:hypothetical protein CISIN_1g035405mg [Citrus sinensis]|uniref:Uncharacterized protein n=1 Tax=Citrus sinensis TaxID=2711 RepID=A0A067E6P2_CITSI|nr:hypothetical protein CISIN_1g035405mg [Citrus sinensis]
MLQKILFKGLRRSQTKTYTPLSIHKCVQATHPRKWTRSSSSIRYPLAMQDIISIACVTHNYTCVG